MTISVMYDHPNGKDPGKGYYHVPWLGHEAGQPVAFPYYKTKHVFTPSTPSIFTMPVKMERFLVDLRDGAFLGCNLARKSFFLRNSPEAASSVLDSEKDAEEIDDSMRVLAELRHYMGLMRKRNFLFAGTLLGWWRQCSLIRHDAQLDTAQRIEGFSDWMIRSLRNHSLRLHVRYGKKQDSLVFQLAPSKWKPASISWLYNSDNLTWIGLHIPDQKPSALTKNVLLYPPIPRICSADLHGYLVYVPCNAVDVIEAHYGIYGWTKEKQNFDSTKDTDNLKVTGSWTRRQWMSGEVYEVYPVENNSTNKV